jgi:hypothetical protein
VVVANSGPTPTATVDRTQTVTPTPSQIPTAGPVPLTPTIKVDLPAVGTRTPQPAAAKTATPTPQGTAILSESRTGGGDSGTDSLIDTGKLLRAARTTATYTVGAFLALGLFFALKALLYWLWQRSRP